MQYPTLSQGARLSAVRLKDSGGSEIGKVVEWMMDVEQGRVVYVVADINGNDDYYAIPWQFMKADLENGGYIIDRQKVEKYNARVDHNVLNNLVNDKGFLAKLYQAYGMTDDGRLPQEDSRTPAADTTREGERRQDKTYPSNAELSEGKGYGG